MYPKYLKEIIGKRIKFNVEKGEPLKHNMITT